MTTTTPRADGRTIGLAHYASRAVLEHVLAPHGVSFLQFVTLRAAVLADGPVERGTLTDGVTGTVKAAGSEVRRVTQELTSAGLLAADGPARVRATDAGRELYATGSTEVAAVSARLYADIPEEDRAVAGRVLALVTERADAELATLRRG
ncbi:MarR family transcriptional regulator [Streptomyces sp. SID161]|uniref:MarR family transcriptional regulator n=1 Tax=unclassified Streptomyces TaxID=2593676 RepID=UPI001368DE45|nr:MarR family transcriptional regulator [Streptomyces sp. SID161]MYW16154.1 MarR family transcriptional regulator [Streptomyces sp. SID2955]MYW45719.1 MarR family transcriptional regulator [Streptomyces sp. SID161]